MTEKRTYYALLLEGDTRNNPSGLVRRITGEDGGIQDEAFKRNESWEYTPVIAGASRGDLTFDLAEVSEEEADRIIERFREKWGAEG